ncbi:MAG: NCS2 family permease, partial [Chlamydiia bacterium]|nr:NCS2 family permease [Chlamydiia bacterium]
MKEILAGLTTFSAMAYIIFVNPHILSEKGMDFQSVMTATILVTALSTLGVALFARHPFVIAPGMGLNAYFAYGMPFPWQTGLAICFFSSLILLILNTFGIREALLKAIPLPLRVSLSAGIGL